MNRYNFVTLLSVHEGEILVSQIPVLVKNQNGKLEIQGHLARENPHSSYLFEGNSTVLFHGPHHYISPRWYLNKKTVPTWDYILIKIVGRSFRLSNDETLELLKDLSTQFDPEWSSEEHEKEDYYTKMTQQIVAFRLIAEEVVGKAKLNQNHPQKNILNVIKQLEGSDPEGTALAEYMKKYSVKN